MLKRTRSVRRSHGDGAVLLVAAARQNAALAAVDAQRPMKLVLKADAAESTQEPSHVRPLIETILSQQRSIKQN